MTSDVLGSPSKVHDFLVLTAESSPVSGNKAGSLLTFTSYNSGLWGLILWCVGWNAACDSQLFQKAIAAHPTAVLGGYTIGEIYWFVLPYTLATTMGLAARALEMTPNFPTYPDRLNAEQWSCIASFCICADGKRWCWSNFANDIHGVHRCIFLQKMWP